MTASSSLVRTALVVTTSDGGASGQREDTSGDALAERLGELGFIVDRILVADDRETIEETLRAGAEGHVLIVTTGGTGLTPRDVTPQATLTVIDYEVPGLAETIRAEGRSKTPFAILSRSVVGVRNGTLIVNTPGAPKAALESLEAIVPVLEHALETLAGPYDHDETAEPEGDAGGDAPGDSTEDQHDFGRRVVEDAEDAD